MRVVERPWTHRQRSACLLICSHGAKCARHSCCDGINALCARRSREYNSHCTTASIYDDIHTVPPTQRALALKSSVASVYNCTGKGLL